MGKTIAIVEKLVLSKKCNKVGKSVILCQILYN